MGWLDQLRKNKETVIPKELESLSAEDIVKALSDKKTLEEKNTRLETERVTEREQVIQLNSQFAEIKNKLSSIEAGRTPAPANNSEEPANFIEEPDKAFNQRVQPLAQLTVATAGMTARMLAQQELNNRDMSSSTNSKTIDGRLFQHWSSEIDREAAKFQSHLLTTPQAWLGIYWYIKGQHSDELANVETRKKSYNFLESAVPGVATPESRTDKKDELTPEEIRIAGRMNVKPEDYLKRKKSMQFEVTT
jgi:phage shock protein A